MLLNPNLNIKELSLQFEKSKEDGHGYVEVVDFINPEIAQKIYDEFESIPWNCKYIDSSGEHHVSGASPDYVNEVSIIDAAYNAGSNTSAVDDLGTVFYYNFYDLHNKPNANTFEVERFMREFTQSSEISDFFERVTGKQLKNPYINATQFRPNHFCCNHSDRWEGELGTRESAFFCHLTPTWKAEWGGQTVFVEEDNLNQIKKIISPKFNVLHLFDSGTNTVHYINYVTPFAVHKRYSLTGWWHV